MTFKFTDVIHILQCALACRGSAVDIHGMYYLNIEFQSFIKFIKKITNHCANILKKFMVLEGFIYSLFQKWHQIFCPRPQDKLVAETKIWTHVYVFLFRDPFNARNFSIESENLSKVQTALIGLRNLKLLIWRYLCFNLEHKLELPLEH